MAQPRENEFESGQIAVDKERGWSALCLSLWLNEQSDFYYQYIHGDKETFHIAFRKLRKSYSLVPHPIHRLVATMCQHDFQGRRIFQHRNLDKWDFMLQNQRIEGFQLEDECLEYVRQLRQRWDCGMSATMKRKVTSRRRRGRKDARIEAVMISCPERKTMREQTLACFANTDWGKPPAILQLDDGDDKNFQERQTRCAHRALQKSLDVDSDFILFLEDDLVFNRHLRHNLDRWRAARAGGLVLGSLYNPQVNVLACDIATNSRLASPKAVFGSQAMLIGKHVLPYIVRNWNRVNGLTDIKISRLAGKFGKPVFYHAPSLVQHVGRCSVWGGPFHRAADFSADWKA